MKAQIEVREMSRDEAVFMVELFHYSQKMPTGKNVFFGCFVDGAAEPYAVAVYGIGASMGLHTSLAKLTFEPITRDNLYELKRLARREPRDDRIQLTQFLSKCHKILARDHGIKYVVSFSDPEHNRFKKQRDGVPYVSGGIYKAANFEYLGRGAAVWHVVDKNGVQHHRRVAYRYKERHNTKKFAGWLKRNGWSRKPPYEKWPAGAMTMTEARAKLGFTPVATESKDRWLLTIG
jgi:hypothetical protein